MRVIVLNSLLISGCFFLFGKDTQHDFGEWNTIKTSAIEFAGPEDRILGVEDIEFTIDQVGGHEHTFINDKVAEENLLFHGAEAAFDLRFFEFEGTRYIGKKKPFYRHGNKLKWEVGATKFLYPIRTYHFLKRKFDVDSIGFFADYNAGKKGRYNDQWISIYGITEFGEETHLADIRPSYENDFIWFPIKEDIPFSALVVERNVLDRNGLGGTSISNNGFISLAMVGDKMAPVNYDWRKTTGTQFAKPFDERIGFNTVITVPDSNYAKIGPVRVYYDLSNFMEGFYGKFSLNPDNFGLVKTHEQDRYGNYVTVKTHYLLNDLHQMKKGGANKVYLMVQGGTGAQWTNDTLSKWFDGVHSWKGEYIKSTKTYILDSAVGSNWKSKEDIINTVNIPRGPHYDVRKTTFQSFNDTTYYETSPKRSYSRFFSSKEHDGTKLVFSRKLSSGTMPIAPHVWEIIGNPQKRDSALVSAKSYEIMGELFFCLAAMGGHNNEIPQEDVQRYLTPGQIVQIATGAIDGYSKMQEANATWNGGKGYMPPMYAGMLQSVLYDGHCGTLQGRFGDHSVGIWTADPDSAILSFGGDYKKDGQWLMETILWMIHWRKLAYRALGNNTQHPYNGREIEMIPKNIQADVHHYFGRSAHQNGPPRMKYHGQDPDVAIPPEEEDFADVIFLKKFVHTYLPEAEFDITEVGYGANAGGSFSPSRKQIGKYNEATGKYEAIAGCSLEGYQWKLNWRAAMVLMEYFDHVYFFNMTDTKYGKRGSEEVWNLDGSKYSKFSFMGLLKPNMKATGGTHLWNNIRDAMYHYVDDGFIIKSGKVWIKRYHLASDPKQIADVVWRPSLENDTTYNYQLKFLPGAQNVQKVEPFVEQGQWSSHITKLGNIATITQDITEGPVIYKYKLR